MTKHTYSPIAFVEQILFEKIGSTKFKVWHYFALLTGLFIVPLLLPTSVYSNQYTFIVFMGLIAITWMSSRLVGRQLSKQSSIDSVLIYRFFAATSWIIPTIVSVFYYMRQSGSMDDLQQQFNLWLLGLLVVVSILHIIGIIIHIKKMNSTIKNVKKDDLFQ